MSDDRDYDGVPAGEPPPDNENGLPEDLDRDVTYSDEHEQG